MKDLKQTRMGGQTFFGIIALLCFNCLGAQDLSQLLSEALENNPEIQAFELQFKISEAEIEEVETLPDTEVGIAYFASETETRVGPQRFKFSAKQMIPWFGTINSRKKYKKAVSETKYEEIILAKRQLIAAVSQSYYNLYTLKEKQRILKENTAVLKTFKTLLLTAVAVDKASAVNVLKLQIRQNEILEKQFLLEQEYLSEAAHFNALLNRDLKHKINTPKKIILPEVQDLEEKDDLSLHPELIVYDKLYESVAQLEALNQKESRPKVGFGVDYVAVDERAGLTIADNGKDILMPMMSFSIPIFNRKYRSKSLQNELKQKEIVLQKQNRFNRLNKALQQAMNNSRAARVSYETQQKNSQQADELIQLLLKKYETATIDLNELLELQELQLQFQIKKIDALQSFFKHRIKINYLIN